ncbi:hypothetical protein PICSAR71_04546 [Mycobacterium avium subsp. paratuberculosis]|nr:hypothetical protein PICSAR71_04546 [Mycobacterium avium subsp. paratuberculosis]
MSLLRARPIQAARPGAGRRSASGPGTLTQVVGNSPLPPVLPVWVRGGGPGCGTPRVAASGGTALRWVSRRRNERVGGCPGGFGCRGGGGSRPTAPVCWPISNVMRGPSGLPMLMVCPSWMSTAGTRRPST